MANSNLTQERLKELLAYNPETGAFTRLTKVSQYNIGDVSGYVTNHGYRRIKIDNKLYMAHRLVWLNEYGSWPKDQIDHINHQRDDNRIINLREATNQNNCKNQSMFKNNTSGFNGVYLQKNSNKWRSTICVDGVLRHIGCFKTAHEAVEARRLANIEHEYHKNHGKVAV